ncbi:GNAT family N-acetyltransferase [Saccharothrix violaceirubra]|uniref:Ribosomal protein S18 acetylase RimI-like enzyme n=1 Tax=Saccharothrix violaceirubra TaxID=413306 RepID=A0A7W7T0E7_9PSEU|nr:GNAT family N-acetyltransferase [Saccharothrix violaceirubra]MBB4963702.1 ribosomal protein S18 acetylase RimI-like enzyme [Saccharothrix violaceirubra]
MTDLHVRPARTEELSDIGALTVAAYTADGLDPASGYVTVLADAATRARDAVLLVAVDPEGTCLGTVTVARHGTPYAERCRQGEVEFRMLAVAPAARRRGVAEALVRTVLRTARDEGAHTVVMSSKPSMTTAHRLYHRLGFTRTPDRDWEVFPGLTLVTFALGLG